MGRGIIKLSDGDRDWYLEWSTITDAPASRGMSRADFGRYYRERYGAAGAEELGARLARVEAKGTSFLNHTDVHDTIELNRAGDGETRLTPEQLIAVYCR